MRLLAPSARPGSAAALVAVRWAFWLLAALVVVGTALCSHWLRDRAGVASWNKPVQNGVYILSAVLVLARALLVPRSRTAWLLLGLALTSYCAGNFVYYGLVMNLDPEPFPSLADAAWVALYPLTYACVVLLLKAHVVRWHASTWLDGLVAGFGLGALAVALVFQRVLVQGEGTTAAVAVALAYPVGDLLILLLLVGGLAVMGWRVGPVWWLLGAGLVAFCVGDLLFLLQSAGAGYEPGTWVDVPWMAAVALMATAAWAPDREHLPRRMDGWELLAVPVLFAAVSVALLVHGSLQAASAPRLVTLLAGATILLALARLALTFREVRQLAEARVQARTDELTGLSNRRHFLELLQDLGGDESDGEPYALLLIDLDRFKEVNDSFGHPVGDELLRLIGPRLQQSLSRGGELARMGGDEFGVLLRGADASAACRVAHRINTSLREAFVLDGMPMHIDASIGIALAPRHGSTSSTLLQRADLAMYTAKRGKLGYCVFDGAQVGNARDRLQTLEELRVAIDTEQLVVHYQPKLHLASGAVIGAEALVRWEHPTRGLVSPDSFLPLAEQAGLMRKVALQVLELSLRDVKRWRAAGHDMHVAVNLSVSNLQDAGLPAQVSLLLDSLGVPAEALVLEITENILMADAERSQQVLGGLRALGVRLAVDDFGTGYSSLAYLRELPVHELKMDRSFVTHLRTDQRAAAIVRSTVKLAHELDMVMVAEGVEDAAVLADLIDWQCDVAQGYHIARPMRAELFVRWLAEHVRSAVPVR